ncbi:MAG: glucose-1-phosphate adenylyltransferase [Deltaproteobacteria bacterium]|nr:glucose-1-phosphate adenylyltransferase [Deltaproteobacteria bacterium]
MTHTLTVVLGGGRGTRLQPLTEKRAKPAVPLGGKYRLIDIPLSNAINSGLRRAYVLTQFNSASLNTHISKTYRFDYFSAGWVQVLAAEQTERSRDWYQGTADAVRQQLHQIDRSWVRDVLILSGDHLYRMDYREIIERHHESGADVTVSCIPVHQDQCSGFGVLAADAQGFVRAFREKPAADQVADLATPPHLREAWKMGDRPYLASMGVYLFRLEALRDMLADEASIDFGHHVLPSALQTARVAAFVFGGYWEDIGTIDAFYRANLALCDENPPFYLDNEQFPLYTRARFLPPSKFLDTTIERSMVADGCVLVGAKVGCSVIGLRSKLFANCEVRESVVMGADFYETPGDPRSAGRIPVGIGEGTSVRRAIIDKNARIGAGCVIHGDPGRADEDHEGWAVRDGIIVVSKNTTIPPGTTL